MKPHTCKYIPFTELMPKEFDQTDFWSMFSEGAPFSWGDNNRTMISVERFREHFLEVMESVFECPSADQAGLIDGVLCDLMDMEEKNIYVDLEH